MPEKQVDEIEEEEGDYEDYSPLTDDEKEELMHCLASALNSLPVYIGDMLSMRGKELYNRWRG